MFINLGGPNPYNNSSRQTLMYALFTFNFLFKSDQFLPDEISPSISS